MKRFSFRLEQVLNFRKSREKQAQRHLYTEKRIPDEGKHHPAIDGKRQQIVHLRGLKEIKGIDGFSRHIYQSYLLRIDRCLEEAHRELTRIKHKITDGISVLKAAQINRKSLEILRENQQQLYLDDLKKDNEKTLDELIRFGRGQLK